MRSPQDCGCKARPTGKRSGASLASPTPHFPRKFPTSLSWVSETTRRAKLHNLNFCLRQKLSALKRSGVHFTTLTFGTPPLYQTKKRGKMGMGPILPQKLSLLRSTPQPEGRSSTTLTFGTPPLYQTKKRGKMGMGPILPQKLSALKRSGASFATTPHFPRKWGVGRSFQDTSSP
jgi:hypothetical protein